MIELNEYFATFYGDLTNVKEDVGSLSDRDPRCVIMNDTLFITFNSALTINEVSDFLKSPDRLIVLQKNDNNLILNMPNKVTSHLFNKELDYRLSEDAFLDTELEEVHPDDIANIDEETKNEIINKLLERHPNLSDEEKMILKKLTER